MIISRVALICRERVYRKRAVWCLGKKGRGDTAELAGAAAPVVAIERLVDCSINVGGSYRGDVLLVCSKNVL